MGATEMDSDTDWLAVTLQGGVAYRAFVKYEFVCSAP